MAIRALALAALLVLTAGCAAAAPVPPPNYALHGDACDVIPVETFDALSGGPPSTRTAQDLEQGIQGGLCTMEFDGPSGAFTLETFIAIRGTGEGATSMYADFKRSDIERVASDKTVSDVPNLGSAAYLARENLLGNTTWKATDPYLYKLGVQHGSLVLTLLFSGNAKMEGFWPTSEQALQDQLRSAVEQIMAKLAAP